PPPPSLHTHPTPPPLYTLSLHDALPISEPQPDGAACQPRRMVGRQPHDLLSRPAGRQCPSFDRFDPQGPARECRGGERIHRRRLDRKSTRLNSSHLGISYAVFCLKKKT